MNRPKEEDYIYTAPNGHKIFEEMAKEEMLKDLEKYCDELEKKNKELKKFRSACKKEYDKNAFSTDNIYKIMEKEFGEKGRE